MSKDTVAKGTVHSSVAAVDVGPPPKAKASRAGLDCELDNASLPVAKSATSVQLDPSHCSVIATAPPDHQNLGH